MKHLAALIALTSTISSLSAQTSFDRDLQQLKEQRDKSAASAVEPINRRYQSALEQLIGRATQAKDLESALKIKEELRVLTLGGTAAALEASTTATKSKGGSDLVAKLPGTTWLWGGEPSMKFTFLAGGRFDGHFKGASWRVVSPEMVSYSWGDNSFSGVIRIAKDFERLDAAEWKPGNAAPKAVFASRTSK